MYPLATDTENKEIGEDIIRMVQAEYIGLSLGVSGSTEEFINRVFLCINEGGLYHDRLISLGYTKEWLVALTELMVVAFSLILYHIPTEGAIGAAMDIVGIFQTNVIGTLDELAIAQGRLEKPHQSWGKE